jgi:hypothetical protein
MGVSLANMDLECNVTCIVFVLEELVQDETESPAILDVSRSLMGVDISKIDLINIENVPNKLADT